MTIPKLTFNILTFDHSSEEYTFYFYKEVSENLQRVYKSLVPDEVIAVYGKQDHYYTSFEEKLEGAFSVSKLSKPHANRSVNEQGKEIWIKVANSAFSKSIMKRFYINQIHGYFEGIGVMTKPNFIDDLEIWLPSELMHTSFNIFDKYTLKIQFGIVSFSPEILVTYEGHSKVFKKSIVDLMSEIAPEYFNLVIYEHHLLKYDNLSDEARSNFQKVFPVLSFGIGDALHLTTEAPDRNNPYLKYKSHIAFLFSKYLNTKEFKQVIPLSCDSFLKVTDCKIGTVTENTNILLFGNNHQHIVPHTGMDSFGPLELPIAKRIQFFYIFHISHRPKVELLDTFLKKGMHSFKGMYGFIQVPFYTEPGFSIAFHELDNPIPEIEEVIRNRVFNSEVQYIAIYVSPYSKNGSTREHKSLYYKVKELLLKRNITSQAIEVQKIKDDKNYAYCLNNISIAILAKLSGVPWRLNVKVKNELVVGIGAFKNTETDTQYIGSAFSFSNNGKFNKFDCFMKNQVDELAGSIIQAVKEYVSVQKSPTRLVIHFYKQMNTRELDIIEDSLFNLGLNIPVFIVSINKTESRDIIAFDDLWSELMPMSGTFINVGHSRYLLFNNTRYPKAYFNINDGYPFPIKLTIKCSHPELEKDPAIIQELIEQVYQFSRMYWKSVRQQNLPVTIKYPEMVAEMFPHFEGNEIPDFGKDNLWFL